VRSPPPPHVAPSRIKPADLCVCVLADPAAYEVAVVFDSLDNFKGYMESDFKTTTVEPQLAKASELFTSEVYLGNRVYDEL
jgi:hypothetical protein